MADEEKKKRSGPTDKQHGTPWAAPPTTKARGGVQRAVTSVLDALAPEHVMSRAGRIPVPIERHRTPSGCVLQAAAAAVSVTWFGDANAASGFGELQITAWRGVVSRVGSSRPGPGGASVGRELTLVPVEDGLGGWAWQAGDGTTYDTEGIVALCATLLEEQVVAAGP
jgi:hypothetical protein